MMKNIFLFSPVAGGLNFLSEKFLVQNETIKGFMCEVCGKVFAVKYSVAWHLTLSIYRIGCVVHLKDFKQKFHLKRHTLQSFKMREVNQCEKNSKIWLKYFQILEY